MAGEVDLIEEAAYRFALLGDPTRLRILHALMDRGELSVGAVAQAIGISRFNVSAHLNRLHLAGLLDRRRQGTTVYYRVADVNLRQICDWMRDALQSRARSLVGVSPL